jgi:hypothetical protein
MSFSKRLAPATYLVGFALFCIPLADAITSTLPAHVHEARWRFGAVGLVSNAILFPALGALIVLSAAMIFDHHRARRGLGVVALVVAVLCVAALGIFVLDAVQTHVGVRANLQLSFAMASTTAALKLVIATATFAALGAAGLRGPIATECSARATNRDRADSLAFRAAIGHAARK